MSSCLRGVVLFLMVGGLLAAEEAKPQANQERTPAELEALVRQLDSDDFALREAATAALGKGDVRAVPLLEKAVNSGSPEAAWRALSSLELLGMQGSDEATVVAVCEALTRLTESGKIPATNETVQQVIARWRLARHSRAAKKLQQLGAVVQSHYGGGHAMYAPGGGYAPGMGGFYSGYAVPTGGYTVIDTESIRFETVTTTIIAPDGGTILLDGGGVIEEIPSEDSIPEIPIDVAEPVESAEAAEAPRPGEVIAPGEFGFGTAPAIVAEPAAAGEVVEGPAPVPLEAPAFEGIGFGTAPAIVNEPASEEELREAGEIPERPEVPSEDPGAVEAAEAAIEDLAEEPLELLETFELAPAMLPYAVPYPAYTEGEGIGVFQQSTLLQLGKEWKGKAEDLAAAADLLGLHEVVIAGRELDAASLKQLAEVKSIGKITLREAPKTRQMSETLRAARPGIEVWAFGTAVLGIAGEPVDLGYQVTFVAPDSAAAKVGLRPGDVVTHVEGAKISDFATLTQIVADFAPGDEIGVTLVREGESVDVRAVLGKRADVAEANSGIYAPPGAYPSSAPTPYPRSYDSYDGPSIPR